MAGAQGSQKPAVRNIDPFEKKRRLAQQDFSSRKVTSRKEEAQMKKASGYSLAGMSPTDYMSISKESYYQEFERPRGSIYTQTLNDAHFIRDNGAAEEAAPDRFKLNKQRRFLRAL